jgi:predicted glycosyltransferase involved in capsule biosynthesis
MTYFIGHSTTDSLFGKGDLKVPTAWKKIFPLTSESFYFPLIKKAQSSVPYMIVCARVEAFQDRLITAAREAVPEFMYVKRITNQKSRLQAAFY